MDIFLFFCNEAFDLTRFLSSFAFSYAIFLSTILQIGYLDGPSELPSATWTIKDSLRSIWLRRSRSEMGSVERPPSDLTRVMYREEMASSRTSVGERTAVRAARGTPWEVDEEEKGRGEGVADDGAR